MQLEHTLSVPAPVDEVWAALLDPGKVAPCMPGAALTGVDGETFTGTVKVKLGPVALTYKGTGRYIETDEQSHRAVIEANAKDTRGNGTVGATITVTLTGDGDRTDGTVVTDMTITGKPAQFGRGMISDVGGKILEQFADCLSKKLGPAAEPAAAAEPALPEPLEEGEIPPGAPFVAPTAGATADAATPASTPEAAAPTPPATVPAPAPEVEPLDLMQYARGSAIQRVVPVAALVAAIVVAVAFFLRRRKM